MNWVKTHYDQFTLAVLSLILLAVAVFLILRVTAFPERFSSALANVIPDDRIPAVDTEVIDQAKEKFANPGTWTAQPGAGPESKNAGLVFTADRYVESPPGSLKNVFNTFVVHSRTGEEMESQWFIEYGLPALDPSVGVIDTDGDGFNNEDEWRYKTDPLKKDDHPPYYAQLFLEEWVKVKFRLKFQAYDGIPGKDPIENVSFQINTLDLRQPSVFLKLGDTVPGTDFKLEKFEFKEVLNESTGVMEDVSELTLASEKNPEDKVVLIYNKEVNSPNQFAKFGYYLRAENVSPDGKTPQEFTVPKRGEFVLKPEVTKRYKLLDVNDTQAEIQTPDGEKVIVKPRETDRRPN